VTEQEWLTCTDPKRMLAFRQGGALWRKRLLYGCACGRLIWRLFTDERSRQAVEVCELCADGLADESEARASHGRARAAEQQAQEAYRTQLEALRLFYRRKNTGREAVADQCRLAEVAVLAAEAPCRLLGCLTAARHPLWGYDTVERAVASASHAWRLMAWQSPAARQSATWWMRAARADLLRDIFGTPQRPVPRLVGWRNQDVLTLAQAAIERPLPTGRLDTARLAILADALEEAGCNRADVLEHLRHPGDHVRGCWAVDLVLARR
jgi:hypothetical protein